MHSFKQVLLVIFDGWGHRNEKQHNAIAAAQKPYFDSLWQRYPHSLLQAAGPAVGLPEGNIGSSEVGHLTIGAGMVVDSEMVRIDQAIGNGSFGRMEAFQKLFAHVKKYDSTLHVMGMMSKEGVHSNQDHLHEFLKVAKAAGIVKIVIHAFTDGRDTPPHSSHIYLKELEDLIDDLGIGFIATASGRFYAMDRDHNWERLERAEEAIFHGRSPHQYKQQKPSKIVQFLHRQGISDEYIEPIVFLDENNNHVPVSDNDGLFFFNFRPDRTRMLSQKILAQAKSRNLCYVTMTEYDKIFDCLVAFPPLKPEITLASIVSGSGLTQTHIAETEKYAHVTYFLNGGREIPFPGEQRFMIESRKDFPTPDRAPQMRAREIADKTLEEIEKDTNFIVINFANPDMVGHTANLEATGKAIEEVDRQLQRVVEAVLKNNGTAFITADHGNAEMIWNPETNQPHTAHTTNPVPAILTVKDVQLKNGSLSDVAPTILELLGLPKPPVMTGRSLISQ